MADILKVCTKEKFLKFIFQYNSPLWLFSHKSNSTICTFITLVKSCIWQVHFASFYSSLAAPVSLLRKCRHLLRLQENAELLIWFQLIRRDYFSKQTSLENLSWVDIVWNIKVTNVHSKCPVHPPLTPWASRAKGPVWSNRSLPGLVIPSCMDMGVLVAMEAQKSSHCAGRACS